MKKAIFFFLFIAAFLTSALYIVLATEYGLKKTIKYFASSHQAEVSIEKIHGTFLRGFNFHNVRITTDDYIVIIANLASVHSFLEILAGKLILDSLKIDTIAIEYNSSENFDPGEKLILMPVDLVIKNLAINNFTITERNKNESLFLDRIKAGIEFTDSIIINRLDATADNFHIDANGKLNLFEPFALEASSNWQLEIDENVTLQASSQVTGTLNVIDSATNIIRPVVARIDMQIDNLMGKTGYHGKVHMLGHKTEYHVAGMHVTELALEAEIGGDLEKLNAGGKTRFHQQEYGYWSSVFDITYDIDHNNINISDMQIGSPDDNGTVTIMGDINFSKADYMAQLTGQWSNIDWLFPYKRGFVTSRTGSFSFTGNHTGYEASVNTSLEFSNVSRGTWNISLSGDDKSLEIKSANGNTDRGQINVTGNLTRGAGEIQSSLVGNTDEYFLGEIDNSRIYLNNATFELDGTTDKYIIAASSGFKIGEYPEFDVNIDIMTEDSRINIKNLDIHQGNSLVHVQGSADLHDKISANLVLHARDINPGILWQEWPGTLSAQGKVFFKYHKDDYLFGITDTEIQGKLRGYPLSAGLTGKYQPGILEIDQLNLVSASSSLSLNGSVSDRYNLAWSVNSPDMHELSPDIKGELKGKGMVQGSRSSPFVTADLLARNMEYAGYGAGELEAGISVDLTPSGTIKINISAADAIAANYELKQASLTVEGTSRNHIITYHSLDNWQELSLSAHGSYIKPQWKGEINSLDVKNTTFGVWNSTQPGTVTLRNKSVLLDHLCITKKDSKICGNVNWHYMDQWEAHFTAEKLPFDLFNRFHSEDVILAGYTTTDIMLYGKHGAIHEVSGSIKTSEGEIILKVNDDRTEIINFNPSEMSLDYSRKTLHGSITVNLQEEDVNPVFAGIKLENIELDNIDQANINLSGNISAGIENLAIFENILPQVSELSGKMIMDVNLAGTMAQPLVSGRFSLTDGTAYIIPSGADITNITLNGQSNSSSDYTVNGTLHSGDGTINISARFNGTDANTGKLSVSLEGENFEVVNLPEAWVLASPDIELLIDAKSTAVTGKVLLPKAKIDLDHIYTRTPVSDDINFVSEKQKEKREKYRLDTDLKIILGDDIAVTGRGVDGKLTGQLDVKNRSNNEFMANGEISMQDGTYSGYGQTLEINEGRLTYQNTIIDNPELSIRAQKEISDITAGVSVKGRASNPVITLYSSPSMGQEQILSYLVFGRPISSLTSDEGLDLISTATTFGLQNSGFITDSIATTFGLDEIKVKTGSKEEDSSLIIGKYLSPRLYVSYGRGLFEAINSLRMQYELSRRWALQTEGGTNVGVDLLYKIEK